MSRLGRADASIALHSLLQKLNFGLSVRFGRYALNLYVALYAHLLNGSGDKGPLAGRQRDLALGIAHRARAGLGHQGHKGVGIDQGEGAVHTEGVHKAAVVEPVLVDEFGTDGGGVVGLVEAELEGGTRGQRLRPNSSLPAGCGTSQTAN